ncbi:non-specific lipid transfer protein GPI-anchored 5-like [Phragmites australis]|uniref:non-specific lipid transfer protein GPI-anchored 5-like n=1 Tax=Phragmites australis TaxID=29695 RepID=UPI002D79C852|nr:non-specific lipid transfer protein GPI-anchored 5-like [Phragmites australis]
MAWHRQRGFPLFIRPCLELAVMAAMCAASTAQQQPLPLPQPTPAMPNVTACPPAQATLSPCVSYFIGNSSSPSAACCSQIQAMFQSQEPCLCAAMASAPSQLGSALGQLLPSSCNLPPNACSGTSTAPPGSTTPASGTTAAAAPATGPTGADPTAPSGGGLKTAPGLLDSAAVSCYHGISAAAVMISLLVVYLL